MVSILPIACPGKAQTWAQGARSGGRHQTHFKRPLSARPRSETHARNRTNEVACSLYGKARTSAEAQESGATIEGYFIRVGSSSDIYSLLVPRAKSKDNSEGPSDATMPSGRGVGGSTGMGALSNDEAAASFLARLAKSGFERDDANGDGYVDKAEYIDRAMQTRPDGYRPDIADVKNTWNKLDGQGKGRLSEQDYAEGLSSVFQVARGTFDKPLR